MTLSYIYTEFSNSNILLFINIFVSSTFAILYSQTVQMYNNCIWLNIRSQKSEIASTTVHGVLVHPVRIAK